MPIYIAEYVATPNPNALKCILKAPVRVPAGMRSYSRTRRNAAPDGADQIGAALMAIPEIDSVLIHEGWITVVKVEGVPWGGVKKAVTRALESVSGGEAS